MTSSAWYATLKLDLSAAGKSARQLELERALAALV
jgi:hypothetical protein